MTIDEIKRMAETGVVRVHKLSKGSSYVMVVNEQMVREEDASIAVRDIERVSGGRVAVISVFGDPKTAIAFYKIDRKKGGI